MTGPMHRVIKKAALKPKKARSGGRQVSAPVVEKPLPVNKNIIVTNPVVEEEDKAFVEKIIKEKKIKPIEKPKPIETKAAAREKFPSVEAMQKFEKGSEDYIPYEGYPLYEEGHLSIEEIQAAEEKIMPAEYYVIVDFEATCDKNNRMPMKNREIIEFAAVLMNKNTNFIESEFTMFVKPMVSPRLTDYCKELTTITQADVNNAFSFGTVLAQFKRWLDKHKGKKTFCSWGSYDKTQLLLDCERHGVYYPFSKEHVDIRKLFSSIKGYKRKYSLASALKRLKLEFQGTKHRGIDDAKNIAAVYQRLLEIEVG